MSMNPILRGGPVLPTEPFAEMGANAASTTPDTPIMRLFHQLRAKRDWVNSQEGLGEKALNSLDVELAALDDEIMRLPVTCAADFAAKLIAESADGEAFPDWETGQIWAEARALTGTES